MLEVKIYVENSKIYVDKIHKNLSNYHEYL